MPMTKFGSLIHDARRKRGMSQQQVEDTAKALGHQISKQTISDWESKPLENVPKTETMVALSQALRIPLEVIVKAAGQSVIQVIEIEDETDDLETAILLATIRELRPSRRRVVRRLAEDLRDEQANEPGP